MRCTRPADFYRLPRITSYIGHGIDLHIRPVRAFTRRRASAAAALRSPAGGRMLVRRLSVLPATIAVTLILSTAAAFGATTDTAATSGTLRDCQKYPVAETYSTDFAGRRSFAASDTGKVEVLGKG